MIQATRPPTDEPRLPASLAEIHARLLNTLLNSDGNSSAPGLPQRHTRLISALLESIQRGETESFDREMLTFLQGIEQAHGDFRPFQNAISALRLEILSMASFWPGPATQGLIENLFHRARVAIGESLRWANLRTFYSLENYAYKLSMITSRLSSCLDSRQLVTILEEDMPKMGMRHARLLLFEPGGEDRVAISRWVRSLADAEKPVERFPTRHFPSAQLYPDDRPLSLAIMALVFQNEPLGYIAFESAKIITLPPIVRQISSSLKAAQLHGEVVDLSLNDELTGVYNRRFMELFLCKEITSHQRFGHQMSVIMVDIDDLKTYNDTYGHLSGDEAIKTVAHCLQSHLRETDIVARYGGDEFILVLPETGPEGALVTAAHIREVMSTQKKLCRPVTLSMGIATLDDQEDTLTELIARADRALYEAKHGGKDRSRIH